MFLNDGEYDLLSIIKIENTSLIGMSKLIGEIYSIKKTQRRLNLSEKHYI